MTEDGGSGAGLSSRQVWLIVGGLLLGTFLSAMDTLVVITALPTIVGDLGGASRISWVITAYLLTSTASAPIYGKLGDLMGRKRLYQIAITIFVGGSVLSGLSQNLNELIGARAIQGIGAGGIMALAVAIIGDIVAPRQRAKYQGVMGISVTAATVIGPLVGGFLVDNVTWRAIFFINVPLGAVALLASTRLRLPTKVRVARVQIDYAGSLLLVGATVCVLLGITWAGTLYRWGSPEILGLGGGVVVLALLFVAQERRAPQALFPPRLVQNRIFDIIAIAAFLLGIAMFGPWTLMPIFLQVVTGASATNSGLLLIPMIGSLTFASIVSGRLVSRWGRYKIFPLVGTMLALLGFGLYTTMGVGTSYFTASIFMVATGLGLGMNLQIVTVIAQNAVDHSDLGVATSGIAFFRQLGGSLGATTALSVFNSNFARNVKLLLPHNTLNPGALGGSPKAIRALAPAVRRPLIEAFARSLHLGFLYTIPAAVLALVVFLFFNEKPILERHEAMIADAVPGGGVLETATPVFEGPVV